MKLCVFIPAYKCEKTIASVIEDLPPKIRRISTILVVDDGSPDKTSEAVKDYVKRTRASDVVLIRNEKNRGYGGAQKVAYRYAIDNGFDAVFMIHGDRQHNAEAMPDVLEKLKGNALSYGSRMLGNPRAGGMPLYKLIGNKTLTALENLLLGTRISEFHSGFRVYDCTLLKTLPFETLTDKYYFDTEMLILIADRGYGITETPIPTIYGPDSGYGIPVTDAVVYSLNVLKTVIAYKLSKYGILKSKFA